MQECLRIATPPTCLQTTSPFLLFASSQCPVALLLGNGLQQRNEVSKIDTTNQQSDYMIKRVGLQDIRIRSISQPRLVTTQEITFAQLPFTYLSCGCPHETESQELGHIGCANTQNPPMCHALYPGLSSCLGPTQSHSHFWDSFHDIS